MEGERERGRGGGWQGRGKGEIERRKMGGKEGESGMMKTNERTMKGQLCWKVIEKSLPATVSLLTQRGVPHRCHMVSHNVTCHMISVLISNDMIDG